MAACCLLFVVCCPCSSFVVCRLLSLLISVCCLVHAVCRLLLFVACRCALFVVCWLMLEVRCLLLFDVCCALVVG